MIKPTCKICRRLGQPLVLRGGKCATGKCAAAKRPGTPGKPISERKHRSNQTEYGMQLREKQKVRFSYGVSEKQFSTYVSKATNTKGMTPIEALNQSLERRLDNVVFVLGFTKSRAHARQAAAHGHITVNGRKMTIPSYQVQMGDVIAVREGSKKSPMFANAADLMKSVSVQWLKIDPTSLSATVSGMPTFSKEKALFNYQTVIEFYSRA
jgi:small subunit ribosomal protein S4